MEKPARVEDTSRTVEHGSDREIKYVESVAVNSVKYEMWVLKEGATKTFYLLSEDHNLESGEVNYESVLVVRRDDKNPERVYREYSETTDDRWGEGLNVALAKAVLGQLDDYSEIVSLDIIDTNPIYPDLKDAHQTGRSPLEYEKIVRYYRKISGKEPTGGKIAVAGVDEDGPTYNLTISFKRKPLK